MTLNEFIEQCKRNDEVHYYKHNWACVFKNGGIKIMSNGEKNE